MDESLNHLCIYKPMFHETPAGGCLSSEIYLWTKLQEDSERSSDEARQCEAEAALELSRVAALILATDLGGWWINHPDMALFD